MGNPLVEMERAAATVMVPICAHGHLILGWRVNQQWLGVTEMCSVARSFSELGKRRR